MAIRMIVPLVRAPADGIGGPLALPSRIQWRCRAGHTPASASINYQRVAERRGPRSAALPPTVAFGRALFTFTSRSPDWRLIKCSSVASRRTVSHLVRHTGADLYRGLRLNVVS